MQKPEGFQVGGSEEIQQELEVNAAIKLIAENERNSKFRDKR